MCLEYTHNYHNFDNFPVDSCTYLHTKAQRVEGGWDYLGVLARSGFLGGGGEISLWQEESRGLDGDWSKHEIP